MFRVPAIPPPDIPAVIRSLSDEIPSTGRTSEGRHPYKPASAAVLLLPELSDMRHLPMPAVHLFPIKTVPEQSVPAGQILLRFQASSLQRPDHPEVPEGGGVLPWEHFSGWKGAPVLPPVSSRPGPLRRPVSGSVLHNDHIQRDSNVRRCPRKSEGIQLSAG